MLLLLLFLALPIFTIIYLLPEKKQFRKTHQPPGPPGFPIIGNLFQLSSSLFHHVLLWQLSKKYGPLMSMRFGSVPAVVISSARIAKEALKFHDLAFSSRPPSLTLKTLSYNGLDVAFAPYGDYWREMKKITVLHLFNPKRVQSFLPIREDEVSNLIKEIQKLAISSQLANLSEMLLSFTSTMICRIGYGKRLDGEKGFERKRFNEIFLEAQAMMAGTFFSDYFPFLYWVDKLVGKVGRLEKNFEEFDNFYQEIVEEHLSPNRPKSSNEDMVDILLKLRDDKSYPFDLTLDHIKAMLMNILLGGTDTGAAIMTWAMTLLIKHPSVMERVQAEIRQMVGKKGIVNEDDIPKLTYFKAAIKETLRLHPPSPLLVPRETTEACTIDGYEIQPKTLVYINAWAIARDPEIWKEPEEFLPERFLGSTIDYKGQNYELIPFGAGRRGCPGIALGMATVELAFANLLYSFDWELPPGMKTADIDMDLLPGLTMHRKNNLCLLPKIYVN